MTPETYRLPVFVKGIVFENNKVWLRLNQRNEWELPGGKMDPGEQPEATCRREIEEELGLDVEPRELIQVYLCTIQTSPDESRGVLVISYLCHTKGRTSDFEHEGEDGKAEFRQFSPEEIKALNMPDFYKEAIIKARTLNL